MKKVLLATLGLAAFAVAATTGINSAPSGSAAVIGDRPSDLQVYSLSDNIFTASTDSILTGECKYYGPYRLNDVGGGFYDKLGFHAPAGVVEAGDSLKLSYQVTLGAYGTLADTILPTVANGGWQTVTDTSFAGGYYKSGVTLIPGTQIWFRILASEGAGNVRIYKSIKVFLEKNLGFNKNMTN